jgi:hypothetical protein
VKQKALLQTKSTKQRYKEQKLARHAVTYHVSCHELKSPEQLQSTSVGVHGGVICACRPVGGSQLNRLLMLSTLGEETYGRPGAALMLWRLEAATYWSCPLASEPGSGAC